MKKVLFVAVLIALIGGSVFGAISTANAAKAIPMPTPTARSANTLQIALLRWYEANQSDITYPAGALTPWGICFDGANIWVTDARYDSRTVSKLRASDGASLGTYMAGNYPMGICFDGANIWVADLVQADVTKLRASDGASLGTYSVGHHPSGVCFDGANIWVTNFDDGTVSKLRASDGAFLGTYTVGPNPYALCFDDANIWVANMNGGTVSKLRASDGASLGTYTVGPNSSGVCFDGANIWVTSSVNTEEPGTVSKLRASDGASLGTYSVGTYPRGICFDGANIWVANYASRTVSKLRASDGASLGTYTVGTGPQGVCFDGANIWVTNSGDNTVSKLSSTLTPNTPVGSNVCVSLSCGSVVFNTVSAEGFTTCTSQQGNPAGGIPSGFRVRGLFIDITTTAAYSGPVTVCITYDPSIPNPQNLRLFHWNAPNWEDVTTSIDPATNTICGQVSGLSPFFVGEEVAQTGGGGCFIATAAYGSYLDSHVQTLRDFRDSYMVTNPIGQSFVSTYYRLSPPIAEFIDDHPALKPVVRVGLLPAIVFSSVAINTTPMEKIAIASSLAFVCILVFVGLRRKIIRGKF